MGSIELIKGDISACREAALNSIGMHDLCRPAEVTLAGVGEIHCSPDGKCGSVEAVRVLREAQVDDFCTHRVLRRLLAYEHLIVGEHAVVAGMDPVCTNMTMFVDSVNPSQFLSHTWADSDPTQAYSVAVSLLTALEKIHSLGIGFRGGAQFYEPDNVGSLKLSDCRNAQIFFTPNGHLLHPTTLTPKDDLISAFVSAPSAPLVALREAVRRQRRTEPFAYGNWVSIFSRLVQNESLVEYEAGRVGHRAMQAGLDRVGNFEAIYEQCRGEAEAIPIFLKDCPNSGPYVCPPIGEFEVASLGPITLEVPGPGQERLTGVSGEVFRSTDRRAVLKVFKSDSCRRRRLEACRERSVLRALNGLSALIPREHAIVGGVDEECKLISLVEDFAGDYSFKGMSRLLQPSSPVLFQVLARLLSILREVHAAGFVHNDAHAGNMVYSELRDVAGSAKLIDFGFAQPFVDANGFHVTDGRGSRKLDLVRLAAFLAEKFGKDVPEFVEYFLEIDALETEGVPDYTKWIDTFTAIAARLTQRLRAARPTRTVQPVATVAPVDVVDKVDTTGEGGGVRLD